jgi:hypothetical protein
MSTKQFNTLRHSLNLAAILAALMVIAVLESNYWAH